MLYILILVYYCSVEKLQRRRVMQCLGRTPTSVRACGWNRCYGSGPAPLKVIPSGVRTVFRCYWVTGSIVLTGSGRVMDQCWRN